MVAGEPCSTGRAVCRACAHPHPRHAAPPRRAVQGSADRAPLGQEVPGEEGAVGAAGRRTAETVSAADNIIEALDLAADEEERVAEWEQVG